MASGKASGRMKSRSDGRRPSNTGLTMSQVAVRLEGKQHFRWPRRAMRVVEAIRSRYQRGNLLLVSHKATLRVVTCALLGLDVRLFRERIAQPVGAVTLFAVTSTTALLTRLGDRTYLSEELQNQEGT